MFENSHLWLDVGYKVSKGELADGKEVALQRTPESSPEWLEKHSAIEDLISFEVFDSEEAQTARLIESIAENLTTDELLPDDIIVINPDPLKTKGAVGVARRTLMQRGVNSNLAGITNSADSFSEPGTVTFTGIFRAKGNEAAMVYIINAQDCFSALFPRDLARVRNRLFTAITRSKAWVRVFGVGPQMIALKEEFERAKASDFSLAFRYPTEAERKEITVVNRDMSQAEKERLNQKQRSLIDLLESLESGETFIEDYPEDVVEKLEAFLSRKKK